MRFKPDLTPSDIIALVALVISLGSAGYSLAGWWKGARITFIRPELASFRCYPATEADGKTLCDPKSIVMVAATNMTYVNEGQSEYGGLLVGETATIKISGRPDVQLHWQEFSDVTTLGASGTDASAQLVPGAGAIAHETRFFPRDQPCSAPCDPRKNFLAWKDFEAAVADPNVSISLAFTATLKAPKEAQQTRECEVFLEPADRQEFATLGLAKTNATSLVCAARS